MGRALFAISAVTVLWSINFTTGKIAALEIEPLFISAIRVYVTAAVLYAFLPPEERKIRPSDWKAFLPLALAGIAGNQTCFAVGIKLTTPSHAAIIHALIPVIVAILAWVMLKERLGPLPFLGFALAVTGAVIVVLGKHVGDPADVRQGDIIIAIGVTGFSFYVVWGRKVLSGMSSLRAVTFAFVFSVPFVTPLFVLGLIRQDWTLPTWKGWSSLVYMIFGASLLAHTLHLYALKRLRAGQVAIFIDLQPAIATAVAVLAGLDAVTRSLILGGALALFGVVLVQLRR